MNYYASLGALAHDTFDREKTRSGFVSVIAGPTVSIAGKGREEIVRILLEYLHENDIDYDYREPSVFNCVRHTPNCKILEENIIIHKAPRFKDGYLIEVTRKLRSDSFAICDSSSLPSLFEGIRAAFGKKDIAESWMQSAGGVTNIDGNENDWTRPKNTSDIGPLAEIPPPPETHSKDIAESIPETRSKGIPESWVQSAGGVTDIDGNENDWTRPKNASDVNGFGPLAKLPPPPETRSKDTAESIPETRSKAVAEFLHGGCVFPINDWTRPNNASDVNGFGPLAKLPPPPETYSQDYPLDKQREDQINMSMRFAGARDRRRRLDSVEMLRDNLLINLIEDRSTYPLSSEMAQKLVSVFQSASQGLVEGNEPTGLHVLVVLLLRYCIENKDRTSMTPEMIKDSWSDLRGFLARMETQIGTDEGTRGRFQVPKTIQKLQELLFM